MNEDDRFFQSVAPFEVDHLIGLGDAGFGLDRFVGPGIQLIKNLMDLHLMKILKSHRIPLKCRLQKGLPVARSHLPTGVESQIGDGRITANSL